jgi:hypothetical protein
MEAETEKKRRSKEGKRRTERRRWENGGGGRGEKRDKEEEKQIPRTGEKLREGGEERQRKGEDTKGKEGRLGRGRGAKNEIKNNKGSRMWERASSDGKTRMTDCGMSPVAWTYKI